MLTHTSTFVILNLSPTSFKEIESKLREAGYDYLFTQVDKKACINMQGIAVCQEPVTCRGYDRDFLGDQQC